MAARDRRPGARPRRACIVRQAQLQLAPIHKPKALDLRQRAAAALLRRDLRAAVIAGRAARAAAAAAGLGRPRRRRPASIAGPAACGGGAAGHAGRVRGAVARVLQQRAQAAQGGAAARAARGQHALQRAQLTRARTRPQQVFHAAVPAQRVWFCISWLSLSAQQDGSRQGLAPDTPAAQRSSCGEAGCRVAAAAHDPQLARGAHRSVTGWPAASSGRASPAAPGAPGGGKSSSQAAPA